MLRAACFAPLLVLVGCAAAPPPNDTKVLDAGDSLLARCQKDTQDADVTAFRCGSLTAVETIVLSASEREVGIAFDQFAASFSGPTTRRIDSVYAAGDARHTWMRLERSGTSGPLEAQMVAVATGGGVRLVTCSTRDPKVPCGPVVSSLVHGRP